jgi:hypothetical protein
LDGSDRPTTGTAAAAVLSLDGLLADTAARGLHGPVLLVPQSVSRDDLDSARVLGQVGAKSGG